MRVRKFLAMPAAERAALLQAAVLVAGVRAALWVVPFGRLRRWAARQAVPREVLGLPAPRLAWMVQAASRFVPRATCLTQALAGQMLLARHGHATRLHIGVARSESGAFEAHAWLESEAGPLLGGRESGRFTRLLALDAGQQ